jgi:hypothetical protein
MTTPAKTAFMTLVTNALAAITSIKDTHPRPAMPTDWDSAKLPMTCYSYTVSRKTRKNRIQQCEFNLQFETLIMRQSDTLDAETVAESILAEIDTKIVAIEGHKPCIKINPLQDDILYFDDKLDKVMAISVYEVTVAHEYGDQTAY